MRYWNGKKYIIKWNFINNIKVRKHVIYLKKRTQKKNIRQRSEHNQQTQPKHKPSKN